MPRSATLSHLVNHLSLGRLKYGWYDTAFVSRERPIFVGGCPRSGTTLLYSLLNAHRDIYLGLETGLLSGSVPIEGVHTRTGTPTETLRKLYSASSCFPEFTEKVLIDAMRRAGKSQWGDKSPVNVTLIPKILRHFPQARFIHVMRDGRDAACSIREFPPVFGNRHPDGNPWDMCVEMWIDWVQKGLAWRHHPNYYEIKYEDMVDDPRGSLGELLEWLGLPWDEDMLGKRSHVKSHPNASKSISSSAHGRWREHLPVEARMHFSGAGNDLLIDLGYETGESWMRGDQ